MPQGSPILSYDAAESSQEDSAAARFEQKLGELQAVLAVAQATLDRLILSTKRGATGRNVTERSGITLTPTEMMLVDILKGSEGPIPLSAIVNEMRARGTRSTAGSVRVTIFHLRNKLKFAAEGASLIETVADGYRFNREIAPANLAGPSFAARRGD